MTARAFAAADMAGNWHVIRTIGHHHLRALFAKQGLVAVRFLRVAAQDHVIADQPDIAPPADGRLRGRKTVFVRLLFDRSTGIPGAGRGAPQDVVDLVGGEPGQFQVEPQRQVPEVGQLKAQRVLVELGQAGELVVGD